MLHPGGARTALFNYLFARRHGGTIALRVEDTDRARSSREFETAQLEDLSWLGLTFDEGPLRQSERGEVYEAAAARLVREGLGYEAADEAGRRALYFRPPERKGRFQDGLRGEIPFSRVEDFVLMKSDGTPSYNFAAVVDDVDMGMTHVIRGEEHLSNTARQALLYRALGAAEPTFIHLGLILGPDGKKLSKRHGARSIATYREEGYLPEALVNHLALLGWTHPEGKEVFANLTELEQAWDPSRLRAAPATFDPERLLSLNAHHIRGLPPAELRRRLESFLEEPLPAGRELVAVEAVQQEMRLLSEVQVLLDRLLGPVDAAAIAEGLPGSSEKVFVRAAAALEERPYGNLEESREFVRRLRTWAKKEGIKTRDLLHPLRLALTGENRGPEIALVLAALGVEEARDRIRAAREARLRV
jgi:glutamyl/glutaminyl-tRNA synthetase